MPNEVNIKITADDLSGPAFDRAMVRMKALKAYADEISRDRKIDFGIGDDLAKLRTLKTEVESIARQRQLDFGIGGDLAKLQALNAEADRFSRGRQLSLGIGDALAKMELLKHEMDDLSFGHIDTSGLAGALTALRSKIQSLGIADLADVNVPPGRIMQQLQLVKRMMNQAGFADLLDFNVQTDQLSRQLSKIGDMSETIPVKFDMSHIPVMGPTQDIFHIPVAFDISSAPKFGDTSSIDAETRAVEDLARGIKDVGYASGFAAFSQDEAANAIARYARLADSGNRYSSFFATGLADIIHNFQTWSPYIGATGAMIGGFFARGVGAAALGIRGLNDSISTGEPLWKNTSNLWFGLGGKIQLFAGALTHIGMPAFIGAASGIHILTDAIIEVGATLIPAIVGIGAFAAAAVDTTNIIYTHFQNMDKVIDYTGKAVYPLSGAFSKMNEAAKPQVYVLLGEGLMITAKNAGILQTVALQAGTVLDRLGARFTYAMTNGNGFNIFIRNSKSDLDGWGTTIGNVGGILGNFLKVMPGYAEIFLNLAKNITGAGEAITGSGIGQGILRIGLAAHGAILYVGLLGTGLAKLISMSLPSIANGLAIAASAMGRMGSLGGAAGRGLAGLSIAADRAAGLPWGWITMAAIGVGFLAYKLFTAKTAAQQFGDSIQSGVLSTSLDKLGANINNSLIIAIEHASAAQENFYQVLAQTQMYNVNIDKTAKQVQAYQDAATQAANYSAAVKVLQGDQQTYNANLSEAAKVFGSSRAALQAFSAAGITTNQFLTTNKQQFALSLIEAQAYNNAIRALTDGTGRYAAAMNALSGPEQFMGDMLKNIQQITSAQDALMTEVTQSQSAFDTFGLGQYTLAQNFTAADKAANKVKNTLGKLSSQASLTGGYIGGISQASLNLSQAFYTQIGNAQKLIDTLEQQEISTKNLTTATATIAHQMIPYAQNNEAARATIVAMINDALGPGTVSLKTLNGWVKANTTSMDGLNTIVAESTIKAGTLANVLQKDLNVQFQQSLLKASGADQMMNQYTTDLVNNQQKTAKGRHDREKLIADLEKTGMTAQDATNYVDGLQGQIDKMHGKSVNIGVTASASGTIDAMIKGTGMSPHTAQFLLQGGLSTGGVLPGYGGGDRRLYMLEDGEAVVSKESTRRYAGFLGAIGVPGLSSGGVTGKFGAASSWVEGQEGDYGMMLTKGFMSTVNGMIQKMMIESVLPGGKVPTGGGPLSSSAAVAQNFAKSIMWAYGWNQGQWPYLRALWNQESSWNAYAVNPTSGAAGIPQNINGWAAYAPGDYQSQIRWGDAYISGRYGNPANAWQHEVAYNWYDHGGVLGPGLTMAYNGTGQNEYVVGPQGIMVTLCVEGGQSPFDKFMAQWIREFVRVKGGGDVQRAFGSRSK